MTTSGHACNHLGMKTNPSRKWASIAVVVAIGASALSWSSEVGASCSFAWSPFELEEVIVGGVPRNIGGKGAVEGDLRWTGKDEAVWSISGIRAVCRLTAERGSE